LTLSFVVALFVSPLLVFSPRNQRMERLKVPRTTRLRR
jgi:hypothetical protein